MGANMFSLHKINWRPSRQGRERMPVIKNAITEYWTTNGYAPSLAEIAVLTGINRGMVRRYLAQMRDMGEVVFQDNVARSVRIVKNGKDKPTG